MIDDASSELLARFVRHDSSDENRRLLQTYLEQNGRPVAFYTDCASLFVNTPKNSAGEDPKDLPPTQIGRALEELGIESIRAYSPQAKGRVERSFGTAQERLVKALRVAGAATIEQANAYLEKEFLPCGTPHGGSHQPIPTRLIASWAPSTTWTRRCVRSRPGGSPTTTRFASSGCEQAEWEDSARSERQAQRMRA